MDIISRDDYLKALGLPAEKPRSTPEGLEGDLLELYLMSLPPAKRYYVIDAPSRLFLLVDGAGPREQLAEEFQRAWARVDNDRGTLVDFWLAAGGDRPMIEVEDGLSLVGRYDADSILFGFNAETVELALKDGMLGDVLGHELGHAWCHTRPDSAMSRKEQLISTIVKDREDEANAKAVAWGFDMKKLEAWGNANRQRFAKMTKNPNYLNPFTPVV